MVDNRDIINSFDSPLISQLASDLKANDVMTQDVITLDSRQQVLKAKEIMREKKISGLPIVDEAKRIVGLISIDDIIHCLEEQNLQARIVKYMTHRVVTVHQDQPIIEVLKIFKQKKCGRLPVVNNDHMLMGIITPGDIMVRLLYILEENVAFPYKRLKKVKGFQDDALLDEEKAFVLTYKIDNSDVWQAGEASSALKQSLADTGNYSDLFLRKVAVVCYEAEVNVVIHAYKAMMSALVTLDFVKIIIADEGPGIHDIDLALEPGWSTASEQVRELGFGAGMGLHNMRRWADELMIESIPGEGTTVTAIIYNDQMAGEK